MPQPVAEANGRGGIHDTRSPHSESRLGPVTPADTGMQRVMNPTVAQVGCRHLPRARSGGSSERSPGPHRLLAEAPWQRIASAALQTATEAVGAGNDEGRQV